MPNYSHLNRDRKHTNLPEEITGDYYEDTTSWAIYGIISVALAIVIGQTFFPEVVTSMGVWLLELVR